MLECQLARTHVALGRSIWTVSEISEDKVSHHLSILHVYLLRTIATEALIQNVYVLCLCSLRLEIGDRLSCCKKNFWFTLAEGEPGGSWTA